VVRTQTDEGVIVRARVLFAGGHLVALGKPALHPAHALLSVHALRTLKTAPCNAELFHDGVPIQLERLERAGDHEARLLIRVEQLADVDRSVRLAGSVCGAEFDLDESGRHALGLFHARFGEERVRAEQKARDSAGESARSSGGQQTRDSGVEGALSGAQSARDSALDSALTSGGQKTRDGAVDSAPSSSGQNALDGAGDSGGVGAISGSDGRSASP
jgi:hypothetical protein